jgi:hypothetical protein
MALEASIRGTSNTAEVDAGHNVNVALSSDDVYVGKAIASCSIDDGAVTGNSVTRSIDIDGDYKTRMATESLQDAEVFDYSSGQNTGKHNMIATTMAPAFTTGGFQTNSTAITTVNTGVCLRTYAMFPLLGTTTLYAEFEMSLSATPQTNTVIQWGLAIPPAAVPWTLIDGVTFRLNSSGISGVISSNGTETVTGPFPFNAIEGSAQYQPNKKYQFIIQVTERAVMFWIDNFLCGQIPTPVGQGRPCMSAALSLCVSHAIVGGAAGGGISLTLNSYSVTLGGPDPADTLAIIGNRIHGAYQGLSGGTMGSLATYANSANPTAAVPANTSLVANLLAGLGGQVWETATIAVNTDGILMSYQVPMGTVSIQGRRLSLKGIYLQSYIQTAITGGPFITQYSLAWGHTAVSLATGESATAKAPRRIALPSFTQVITATQAVSTMVSQPGGSFVDLGDAGIIVNPGEFIALVKKNVGTVGTAGTVAHLIQPIYGWL